MMIGWRRFAGALFAVLALGLLAALATAKTRDKGYDWPRGEVGELLERVCKASRRCSAAPSRRTDPRGELVDRLRELPTLTDGHTRADKERLRRLDSEPLKQLGYALDRAVDLMGKHPRGRGLDRGKRIDLIGEWLVVEYEAGYWSTLPDDLAAYEQAIGSIGQSGQGVQVSLNIDVNNSWANEPTFLLDASAGVSNGPATHFRMWCDQCGTITTGDDWVEWSEWKPQIVVTGDGYKNICIQVRADPYQGNFENMAIDCDELGTPPSPADDDDDEPVAEANNPVQRCFGAIGNHCGAADEDLFEYGHCVRMHPFTQPDIATCQINAGSWEHDECCIEKRVGGNAPESEQGSCSLHMAVLLNQPYVCEAEFNKAVARLGQFLTWTRNVDATIENTTGIVDFSAYCAQAGSIVFASEVEKYCCSGTGEVYTQSVVDALAPLRRVCL